MQCSTEALCRFFYNVSSTFLLLLTLFYFVSIFLSKFFHYLGGNLLFPRAEHGYEDGVFSEEEEEAENVGGYDSYDSSPGRSHLVADVTDGGDTLVFRATNESDAESLNTDEEDAFDEEEDNREEKMSVVEDASVYCSPASESMQLYDNDDDEDQIPARDPPNTCLDSTRNYPTFPCNHTYQENNNDGEGVGISKDRRRRDEEKHLAFAAAAAGGAKEELKKAVEENNNNNNNNNRNEEKVEIYGDSCTVGSTSKSSSEWRSSINCTTEDPFSSSSRRSCPKWESYTVFQKYDEEMLFLDRITAQKLHETESLRSIQSCPRSISERIVHKLAAKNKSGADFRHNPYHELESAYVAQICLTWEALNWNYKYFQRLRAARREGDPGCPAYIAQQFQQFQVLLQRYIENEPYEHGRRPEIYARMRSLAPKLLQVPEYRDSYEEEREGGDGSRVGSGLFLQIIEEAIKTFMNFLKADRENRCQILAALFKKNPRGGADPTLLLLLKKINKKKKWKLKDLGGSGNCLRKRRLRQEEEMEVLMAEIDLKVVSRVLRMREVNDEQLHWCEDKMSKVRVSDRKLHRDSSPLFFPAH